VVADVLSVEIDKNLLVMPYTFQLACHQEVISMVTLMLMVAMLVVSTHFGAYDYHHHRINDDCHVRPYVDPYRRRDYDLGRVKVSIPSFTGKEDVDALSGRPKSSKSLIYMIIL
jgi:hypothetical protein